MNWLRIIDGKIFLVKSFSEKNLNTLLETMIKGHQQNALNFSRKIQLLQAL